MIASNFASFCEEGLAKERSELDLGKIRIIISIQNKKKQIFRKFSFWLRSALYKSLLVLYKRHYANVKLLKLILSIKEGKN